MKWLDDKATYEWAEWHQSWNRWHKFQLALYRLSHYLPYWGTEE